MNALTDNLEKDSVWQKTPYVNLLRYKPSQVYFARFRVKGKLIRRSLKTNSITVAKMRLADLEKGEQQKAQSASAGIVVQLWTGHISFWTGIICLWTAHSS